METRRLGSTGHPSSVLTLGGYALSSLTQDGANQMVELAVRHGVNHFDVAPTYGDAELKIGPKTRQYRDQVFLGCKTQERTAAGARRELERSLLRMGVDHIDLYQFHAVTQREEIEAITAPDGALRAFRAAKDDGLISHIGLTSHGRPDVILEAIDRIDELESVMFPMNPTVGGKDGGKYDYAAVLDRVIEEDIGALGIKAFAKRPWPPEEELPAGDRPYATWYEPHDTQSAVDDCVNYALSAGMTSITTAGDPKLLPMILHAAERPVELADGERHELEDRRRTLESPVPRR